MTQTGGTAILIFGTLNAAAATRLLYDQRVSLAYTTDEQGLFALWYFDFGSGPCGPLQELHLLFFARSLDHPPAPAPFARLLRYQTFDVFRLEKTAFLLPQLVGCAVPSSAILGSEAANLPMWVEQTKHAHHLSLEYFFADSDQKPFLVLEFSEGRLGWIQPFAALLRLWRIEQAFPASRSRFQWRHTRLTRWTRDRPFHQLSGIELAGRCTNIRRFNPHRDRCEFDTDVYRDLQLTPEFVCFADQVRLGIDRLYDITI